MSDQVSTVGFDQLENLLAEISKSVGHTAAAKSILVPAARDAMKPALTAAKANLFPGHGYDTGQLQRTLAIKARTTTSKDRRSKYIDSKDAVIAVVEANINKIKGDKSDARHIAVEFGTANMAARPYLRPALEATSGQVTEKLRANLAKGLEKFKASAPRKDTP